MLGRLKKLMRPRAGTRAAYRFHLRYWFHPDAELAAGVLATQRASRALRPEISDGPDVERITVIAPHPDDEMMGPGGTLIRLIANGRRVDVVFLSDGEPDCVKASLRREEAVRVAGCVGFRARFLGLPANRLSPTPSAIKALTDALQELQPQVLMLPFILDDNDDHRAANLILVAAAEKTHLPRALEVWAYQVYSALPVNVLGPLGEYAAKKIVAIRMYASQTAIRDWAHFALGLNAYNTRLAPRGVGDPYLEAFYVIPFVDYLGLCQSFDAVDRR